MLGLASLERRSWPALDGSLREQERVGNVRGYIEGLGPQMLGYMGSLIGATVYIRDTAKPLVPHESIRPGTKRNVDFMNEQMKTILHFLGSEMSPP